jgi:hypothetical protein
MAARLHAGHLGDAAWCLVQRNGTYKVPALNGGKRGADFHVDC